VLRQRHIAFACTRKQKHTHSPAVSTVRANTIWNKHGAAPRVEPLQTNAIHTDSVLRCTSHW
jgi:hypothetical protein